MPRATIESKDFTLFYDYDQLRDGKLSQLTNDGKIEWFRLRMEMVFLEPLRRIFDRKSRAYLELDSTSDEDLPLRAVMIAAFSILLNGIEALGSFTTPPRSRSRKNFIGFIRNYMSDWNIVVLGTSYQIDYLPEILWNHFRNGIVHGFVIEGGGIEYDIAGKKWVVEDERLKIDPIKFFADFLTGIGAFFTDIKEQKSKKRTYFISRFKEVYPC
jgi:hypothetical protein